MKVRIPLILFIDAYDSFSNNIISLLETTLHVAVRTIKIDDPVLLSDAALHEELEHYVAVVCGPGPGHPEKEEDAGIMRRIWRLNDAQLIPVLGICLGFQSLCLEFGGKVQRLHGPQHGIIRRVTHIGESDLNHFSIFDGVGEIKATHYQSLCADIGQTNIPKSAWESSKWHPTSQCPDLLPLAWLERRFSEVDNSGVEDDIVLVAVEHKTKPFWALQYHPESICTNAESKEVIINWFKHAQDWNRRFRQTPISFDGPIRGQLATRKSLLSRSAEAIANSGPHEEEDPTWSRLHYRCAYMSVKIPSHISTTDIIEAVLDMSKDQIILESSNAHEKSSKVRGRYTIIALEVEASLRFEYKAGSYLVLESRGSGAELLQRTYDLRSYGGIWCFLAKYLDDRKVLDGNEESPFWGGFIGYTTYELGLETIDVKSKGCKPSNFRPDLSFVWVEKSLVIDHEKNMIYVQALGPKYTNGIGKDFVGGSLRRFVDVLDQRFFPEDSQHYNDEESSLTLFNIPYGTTSQDIISVLGKASIRLPSSLKLYERNNYIVAICHYSHLEWHNEILWVIQNGIYNDQLSISGHRISTRIPDKLIRGNDWAQSLPRIPGKRVRFDASPEYHHFKAATPTKHKAISIKTSDPAAYESKVVLCQQHIRAGDSYELCLTNQPIITTPSTDPWSLYLTLRRNQPSPFSSYIHLPSIGTTFLSASPERFLSWTSDGVCELRPMKGTVRKGPSCPTLKEAEKLLNVPKEIAENLMIVDLVRHDLHSVCGSGNVTVPSLMVVEEYKSVFQMISIVRGQLPGSLVLTPTSSDLELENNNSQQVEEEKEKELYTGLDILASSLPPGSMTGAPKKRSCELLQDIEEGVERGLYSGVTGYLDVGGRGDWSVNIRCLFRYDDEDEFVNGEKRERWHVGAGGAVTVLSGVKEEREEMETKLVGSLGLWDVEGGDK